MPAKSPVLLQEDSEPSVVDPVSDGLDLVDKLPTTSDNHLLLLVGVGVLSFLFGIYVGAKGMYKVHKLFGGGSKSVGSSSVLSGLSSF